MKNFSGIGLAWFLATVVAVTIAAAAVGSVRSVVTDVPTALGVSALPVIAQGETAGILGSPGDAPVLDQATTTSTLASIVEIVTTDPQEAETTTVTAASQPVEQVVIAQDHPEREEEHEEKRKSRPQGGSTPSETHAPSEPSGTPVTTTSKPPAQAATNVTTTTAPQTATTTTTTPPAPTPPPPTTTPTPPTPPTPPTIFIPESPNELTATTTQHDAKAYTKIIDTDGGSLSVRVSGDTVVFRRAYPKTGWRFDLADGGPEVVLARFMRTDDRTTRIRVVATVIDGNLEVSITQPN